MDYGAPARLKRALQIVPRVVFSASRAGERQIEVPRAEKLSLSVSIPAETRRPVLGQTIQMTLIKRSAAAYRGSVMSSLSAASSC